MEVAQTPLQLTQDRQDGRIGGKWTKMNLYSR